MPNLRVQADPGTAGEKTSQRENYCQHELLLVMTTATQTHIIAAQSLV